MTEIDLSLLNDRGTLVYRTSLCLSNSNTSSVECFLELTELIDSWSSEVYGITSFTDEGTLSPRRGEILAFGSNRVEIKQIVSNERIIGEFSYMGSFFDGLERTTIQFHLTDNRKVLSISTHMFSKNKNLSLFEIPRESERLGQIFVEKGTFDFIVGGEIASPDYTVLTHSNVEDSILARPKAEEVGLPIVIFDVANFEDSETEAFSSRCFGLAHVFLVDRNNTPDLHTGKVFVKWRNPSRNDLTLEHGLALAGLYRGLVQYQRESDTFSSEWHVNYLRAINQMLEDAHKKGSQASDEVAILRLQLEEVQKSAESARTEIDVQDYISSFERDHQAYKAAQNRYMVAIGELRSRLQERFNIKSSELALNLSPETLGDARSEFDVLSSVSNGAIIFTANCVKTWKEAIKLGYSDHTVMETQLVKLSIFAMDFASKASSFGTSLVEYAKNTHSIDIVLGDHKLPVKYFTFDGKSYNQEAHVRADSGSTFNQLGRIHFSLDQEKSRVIVNVVGSKQYKNDK